MSSSDDTKQPALKAGSRQEVLKHTVDNALMAAISKASLDALITINSDGRIIEFGPSAEELFGFTRAEALGQNVAEIVIPPSLRSAHHAGMKNYHATGEGPVLNNRVEVMAWHRSGREFPAELTVIPIKIAGETMFTAFVRDISERKAYEQSLLEAREAAEQASQAKSRFLTNISHELRTPLHSVQGAADMLEHGPLTTEQHACASMIRQAGRALLGMVDEVLDYTRLDASEGPLLEEEVDLKAVIAGLAETAAVSSHGLDIAYYLGPGVPAKIRSDQHHLRLVMRYMLDAALKSIHEGGVAILVHARESRPEWTSLCVEMAALGVGVAADPQQASGQYIQEKTGVSIFPDNPIGDRASLDSLVAKMQAQFREEPVPGGGFTFRFEITAPCSRPEPSPLKLGTPVTALLLTRSATLAKTLPLQLEKIGARVFSHDSWSAVPEAERAVVTHLIVDLDTLECSADALLEQLRTQGFDQVRVLGLGRQFDLPSLQADYRLLLKPVSEEVLYTALQELSDQVSQAESPIAVQAMPSGQQPSGRRKILVVEDGPTNRLIVQAILEKGGYAVELACHGQEALDKLEDGVFDLVLMDLRMPVMDGLDASRHIRQCCGAKGKLPIVALTANATPEDIDAAREAGMDEFLSKPIDRARLLGTLERILASTAGNGESTESHH